MITRLTVCPEWVQHTAEPKPGDLPHWSGKHTRVPAVGERVKSRLGPGIVQAYFVEAGFLGVELRLTKPPKWFVEQNKLLGKIKTAELFGAEITLL